ncbi:MAG: CD1871A family CXXC motif-containing protein [Candidatus Aminicenantes bacterium]
MMKKKKTAVIIFLISCAALIAGLLMDEFRSVWEKAVMVCLSCIGIG